MDSSYGEQYRALYESHWWWRARESLILGVLRERIGRRGAKRILDVGCGDGLFFDRLSAFGDVEGVEPDARLLSQSPRREAIYVGPFDESFNPGKQYSAILFLDVLEHLDDPQAAIRHALSLLEPTGFVLVTVPAFTALWTTHDVLNHHKCRYTDRGFRSVANRAGLVVQESRYFFHWLFPLKLMARAVEAVARPRPHSPRTPPAWLNRFAYSLSVLEQRVLGPLHLPFGSSLLALGTHDADVR
jgi:SAM-dependent methyltransferase